MPPGNDRLLAWSLGPGRGLAGVARRLCPAASRHLQLFKLRGKCSLQVVDAPRFNKNPSVCCANGDGGKQDYVQAVA